MLTTCFAAAIVYVLSYPPYLAARYETPTPISIGVAGPHFDTDDESFANTSHTFYSPVEWLIDHTPLDKPLMAWARVWNVQDKMSHDSLSRSNSKAWQELNERARRRREQKTPNTR